MGFDKKAAEAVFCEHEPYIRKLCTYKLQSLPHCADDCVQEVFLDFCDALNKGKTIERPRAWLTKVANNKIVDIYKQAKKEAESSVAFDGTLVEITNSCAVYDDYFHVEEAQLEIFKEKTVARLSEAEKRLLHDRYTLNKSISVIAKEHGTTEDNVYQRLFRLKQKTKMLIENILNE